MEALFALVSLCDEVITVSNATAHIAGSLGKNQTVLCTNKTKWRWGDDFNPSHWYENCSLIRTDNDDNWEPVFSRIRAS
jgi:hypothetical protein